MAISLWPLRIIKRYGNITLPDTVDYSHIHNTNKEKEAKKAKRDCYFSMFIFSVPGRSLSKVT